MEENEILLSESFIVLGIPTETVEIKIRATIYKDDKLINVEKKMGFVEVKQAMKEAEENYIPGDAVFSITPLGEKYLDELEQKRNQEVEE